MEKLSVIPTTKKPTLQEVLSRFETWRKGKKVGSRIPKCLWKIAVEICDAHSVCEASINYNELKRRCAAAKPSPTRFVELAYWHLLPPALRNSATPPAPP